MLVALALALALSAPPTTPDTVELKNGGVLRGTIVQDVPGQPVVIELPTGETWTVPRETVARVERAPRGAPGETFPPPPPPQDVSQFPPPPPAPSRPLTAEEAAAAATAEAEAAARAETEALAQVPVLQFGVSMGLAVPLGNLGTVDAAGVALGAAVSPMLTFDFEFSFRPIPELELGVFVLAGLGTSYDPLNGYCVAVGGWCDAANLVVGLFPRLNFMPRSRVNPWIMATGGYELLTVSNAYEDAFDFSGWQVGGAAGVDIRWPGGAMLSFQLGTRWGEYTTLSVKGYLPPLAFTPATHGWVDLAVKGSYGL